MHVVNALDSSDACCACVGFLAYVLWLCFIPCTHVVVMLDSLSCFATLDPLDACGDLVSLY